MRSDTKFKFTTQQLTRIGLMAALVFASNYITSPEIGNARLHVGNICMLLSGLYLGALPGGLAAGVGAAMFDLFSPGGIYITSAPTTFIFRFLMAFTVGALSRILARRIHKVPSYTIASIAGSLLYVFLFVCKKYIGFILIGNAMETAVIASLQSGAISLVNAAIGVVVAVPLSLLPLRRPGKSRQQ